MLPLLGVACSVSPTPDTLRLGWKSAGCAEDQERPAAAEERGTGGSRVDERAGAGTADRRIRLVVCAETDERGLCCGRVGRTLRFLPPSLSSSPSVSFPDAHA